ncbi:hypothetical protein [Arthrobacter bussei]|uniref:Uncharacterized protein n=1 Tax=Arthrobacter bussei TaxID=2594179 RepID=A0A7X1NSY6_9MICC|nr:hypothetical protein [Arthrobacter bussei]MPY12317.1 hypothetical protein [Arthrobacter bussei]
MEQPVLDALYEAGSSEKVFLGYVAMTDHTDMINTRSVTLWQPAPSTLKEAKAWADGQQEIPANYRLEARGVVSFILNTESTKTAHDRDWTPVRD